MSRITLLGLGWSCLAGCPISEPEPKDCKIVEVDSAISEPTVWSYDPDAAGTTYHVPAFGFKIESDLAIEPGVVVKVDPGEKIWVNTGSLTAEGTADDPVVFTSSADGSAGCDIADGEPARGDWIGILLDYASGASFRHIEVRYAGEGSAAALDLEDRTVEVSDSVFAHNAGYALDVRSAPEQYTIAGNTFYDNYRPMAISAALSLTDADGNVFSDAGIGNDENGIFLLEEEGLGFMDSGSDPVVIDWGVTEVPFVLGPALISIARQSRLQVHEGVVVKGSEGTEIQFFSATETLRVGEGAVFTSLHDDSRGGDTDGAATSPADGDWGGIFDEDFSSDDPYEGAYVRSDAILYDSIHDETTSTGEHDYSFPEPE